jgi:cysteine desulfurase
MVFGDALHLTAAKLVVILRRPMQNDLIYLDCNATTPVDPAVMQAMLPYFTEYYGNAASKSHPAGWRAEAAVEKARKQVASLLACEDNEIIFTSGSTEGCNLAIKGVFEKYKSKGNHIVVVSTEHKAVLDACAHLEQKGAQITYLQVSPEGVVDLDYLMNAITDKTILVCAMLANNETGVIHPLSEISKIAHERGTLVFCDATQAVGKMHVTIPELGADLLCLSAHKFYGPKGVGALYVKRKSPRVVLEPLIDGGGHEKGLRSGTLNVPGIVGLGQACEIATAEMWDNNTGISALRAKLEHNLLDIDGVRINGSTRNRLYNTSNICFSGVKSADLIPKINHRICVSSGSACSSALAQPSHVLKAMGLSDADSFSSIRFSLGKFTTEDEINETITILKGLLAK